MSRRPKPLTMIQSYYLKRCAEAPVRMNQLNPSMQALRERGFVTAEKVDDEQPYLMAWTITDEGRDHLDAPKG